MSIMIHNIIELAGRDATADDWRLLAANLGITARLADEKGEGVVVDFCRRMARACVSVASAMEREEAGHE